MSFFRQFPKTVYDFQNAGIGTTITDLFRFVQSDLAISDDISVYQYYNISDGDRPDIVSQQIYGTPDYYWTFFLCNENLKNGLGQWPMSQQQFDNYIDTEYDGTAIITYPYVEWTGNYNIADATYVDSLAGKFKIGETVNGLYGGSGIVFKRDAQMSQLILRNVTGTFRTVEETVTGVDSEDSVSPSVVLSWRDAPHHYVKADGTISYDALYIDEQFTPVGRPDLWIDNPEDVTNPNLTAVSNYEYELDLNEKRANIRVVRPEHIYKFAQAFNQYLNA
jgi:hypothetical protein